VSRVLLFGTPTFISFCSSGPSLRFSRTLIRIILQCLFFSFHIGQNPDLSGSVPEIQRFTSGIVAPLHWCTKYNWHQLFIGNSCCRFIGYRHLNTLISLRFRIWARTTPKVLHHLPMTHSQSIFSPYSHVSHFLMDDMRSRCSLLIKTIS
jgi:hypothetical protein